MDWKTKLKPLELKTVNDIENDLVSHIIRYENDGFNDLETICLFIYLINTSRIWGLQGFYQRQVIRLVENELIGFSFETDSMGFVSERLLPELKTAMSENIEHYFELWKAEKLSEDECIFLIKVILENNINIWRDDRQKTKTVVSLLRQGFLIAIPGVFELPDFEKELEDFLNATGASHFDGFGQVYGEDFVENVKNYNGQHFGTWLRKNYPFIFENELSGFVNLRNDY